MTANDGREALLPHQSILAPNETLIFLHIPKTGGTTVSNLLTQAVKPAIEVGGTGRFQAFIRLPKQEIIKYRLAYGHVPYGIHELVPQRCKYVAFLRNPVDRLISAYYYIMRTSAHGQHSKLAAAGMSLREFARNASDFPEHNNTATRFIGNPQVMGWRSDQEVKFEHLERAKERLASFAFVGFQETLDEDVTAMLSRVGAPVPTMVPRYLAGSGRPSVLETDTSTIDAIRDANRFDIELFQFARKMLRSDSITR